MAPICRGLLSTAALLVLTIGTERGDEMNNAFKADEVCDAFDPDCTLSLRQLRANVLSPDADDAGDTSSGDLNDVFAQVGKAKEALEARRSSSWTEHLEYAKSMAQTLQGKKQVVTGFHQTSQQICDLILKEGFKPGHQGWCGGAIYFATDQAATYTKAIGLDSHLGCMLKVQVDIGKARHMSATCLPSLTEGVLKSWGYDSVLFNPGDGQELVVYDPKRILSIEKLWSHAPPNCENKCVVDNACIKEYIKCISQGDAVQQAAEIDEPKQPAAEQSVDMR